MPSRISGACNGCRTKKQKCSGDRTGCSQCHAAGIQCTWPEQRKRGPAKGYIEGLEHRLHEAESLLLALLPLVTSDQLNCATDSRNSSSSTTNIMGPKSRDSQSPSPRNARSSPPVLNKKTGIEYWESFPLDTAENIRKWQEDCAMHTHSQSSSNQNQSSFRNSGDDFVSVHTQVGHALSNSGSHSRPGSVDLSRHSHSHSYSDLKSGPFRSMSTDSYRSGTSTPVNVPQHSLSQSSIPTTSAQQAQNSQQPNWQNLSLFSPLPNTNSTNANASNSGVGIGAEALLLQSFADSSWAQSQSMNGGMGMSTGMGVESGPMEIDTGFFTNDMQRRLFW